VIKPSDAVLPIGTKATLGTADVATASDCPSVIVARWPAASAIDAAIVADAEEPASIAIEI
jgi:hypothetical protein